MLPCLLLRLKFNFYGQLLVLFRVLFTRFNPYLLTHPPTIKALQTTVRTKLRLLSLTSMWYLTRSRHTPCPTGKRSRTSTVKQCCSNNHNATDPREVILSYEILYWILNSWNATLMTFHFPRTVQHNPVPKFHTYFLE